MRTYTLFPAIFLLAALAPGQAAPKPNPIPDRVQLDRDRVYAQRPSGNLTLDLYRPQTLGKAPLPVVIWIHGGGWAKGNKSPCPATWLATQGYAVASVQYRLTDVAPWPAQIEDCREAIRWLRQNAKQYQLDAERIGVWGGSAGGHLVALLGTLDSPSEETTSSRVQAVCDFYGPTDLLTMPANTPGPGKTDADLARTNGAKLLGGSVKDHPDRARSASAIHQVTPGDAPVLVVHGDQDTGVPLDQSRRFVAKLTTAGVPAELVVLKGAGHGGPAFQTPTVRGQVRAFFDRHLKPQAEFTTLVAHWSEYGDDSYLDFVREARPEVCQLGFYGGHFYSLAHTPQYKGYPAHFPVQGLNACGGWFDDRNKKVHELGSKVVGHFNVTFLVGEPDGPEGPRGFFQFYRELWNEQELGPKPVADPLDLLARNADGSPMSSKNYSIGKMREFTACLNNPHWRTVLKAWAKRGLDRGVDGYMINYFYRHNCLCEHCQKGFRGYLRDRFSAGDLRSRFGIANVDTHTFSEIVGWHDPKETTPLRLEMLKFSQLSTKQAFDDVFVHYARSLKPDLMLGQWNHLSNFSQIRGDERSMVPSNLWGRDETYLWYSLGASGCYTDLANGYLGEGTLQARYIRGSFDDKPFTLGKYEQTRIRAAISELAANGGAPMGFYCRHNDPEAREVFVRYYNFLRQYDGLYRDNRSHAEVLLLYPRSKVHAGDVASVEAFKALGTKLLDEHVLFDVKPDDRVTPGDHKHYRAVIDPTKPTPVPTGLSRFTAPQTVRVSVSKPALRDNARTLHFVNYNRTEPTKPKSPGRGIADEKPIPVQGVAADFLLPGGQKVFSVSALTPEQPEPAELKFTVQDGRLRFAVPKFLVYSVVRVQFTGE
jgi:acetyl esterase/lipase